MAEYWKHLYKSYSVLGYTYEADIHCPGCTIDRFGEAVTQHGIDDIPVTDTEGNPVYPLFADQTEPWDVCGDCHTPILEGI